MLQAQYHVRPCQSWQNFTVIAWGELFPFELELFNVTITCIDVKTTKNYMFDFVLCCVVVIDACYIFEPSKFFHPLVFKILTGLIHWSMIITHSFLFHPENWLWQCCSSCQESSQGRNYTKGTTFSTSIVHDKIFWSKIYLPFEKYLDYVFILWKIWSY